MSAQDAITVHHPEDFRALRSKVLPDATESPPNNVAFSLEPHMSAARGSMSPRGSIDPNTRRTSKCAVSLWRLSPVQRKTIELDKADVAEGRAQARRIVEVVDVRFDDACCMAMSQGSGASLRRRGVFWASKEALRHVRLGVREN